MHRSDAQARRQRAMPHVSSRNHSRAHDGEACRIRRSARLAGRRQRAIGRRRPIVAHTAREVRRSRGESGRSRSTGAHGATSRATTPADTLSARSPADRRQRAGLRQRADVPRLQPRTRPASARVASTVGTGRHRTGQRRGPRRPLCRRRTRTVAGDDVRASRRRRQSSPVHRSTPTLAAVPCTGNRMVQGGRVGHA
jgi:hypothetical protein